MEQAGKSFSELEEIVELSYLFDFYGALLKDSHRTIFEDYVLNNLSLSEIASERQITRQGVYDIIKRCRRRLRDYEDKLHLVRKFEQTREKLKEIERIAKQGQDAGVAKEIAALAQEIYELM